MKSDISVIPLNVVKNNVALFERKTIESSNESNSIRFKSNPIRFRNNFINESTIQQRSVGNKSLVDYSKFLIETKNPKKKFNNFNFKN